MSPTMIIARAIEIYTYVILGAVIISWLPIDRNNPLVEMLETLTAPVLNPIRALMPPEKTGGLDFSPIVALVALQFLAQAVVNMGR